MSAMQMDESMDVMFIGQYDVHYGGLVRDSSLKPNINMNKR